MSETIFITGATSGIGEATARLFAERGHHLVLLGRRSDRLDALARELSNTVTIAADLRDFDTVKKEIANLPESHREVTVLVNNAGLALGMETAQRADVTDWDTMIDINVKSLVRLTHLFLPAFVERNRGHVINLGSVAGTYPYVGGNVYGATKAFVEQFTLNLRADLFGTRVRVTNIEPGMVATEFSEVRFKGDKERAAAVYRGVDALTASDIAEAVRYVAELPERVNINRLEIMSVSQSFAGFAVKRDPAP